MHDFVKSYIKHLEDTGLLIYVDHFNAKTFHNFFFPTVQQGGQVILTCIRYNYIFAPAFLLIYLFTYLFIFFIHEYLDKVLNAIQQDLLVNKSLLQVHDFLF